MGIRLGIGLGIGWERHIAEAPSNAGKCGTATAERSASRSNGLVIGRFKVVGNQRIRTFGHWSHFQVHEFLFPPFGQYASIAAASAVENTATIESHAGTRQTSGAGRGSSAKCWRGSWHDEATL